MSGGTLGQVFARLADEQLEGMLRLERDAERYVVHWASGRVVGLTDGDGTPVRTTLAQLLVAGGLVSGWRLLRERRRAARRGETLEWRLARLGVPDTQLRRLVTLDVRERLLGLMDAGNFVARVVRFGGAGAPAAPTADAWLDPLSVPALVRAWSDRRAERQSLGARLPAPEALFRRTAAPPVALFRLRGATVLDTASDPYAARTPQSPASTGAAFPPVSRLVYLHVDGLRRVTEIARAAGAPAHDVGVALVALEGAGLVQRANRESAAPRALPGLGVVVALVALALAAGAVVARWSGNPPLADGLSAALGLPSPDADAACRGVQRALAFEHWRAGRYPDTINGLFLLPEGAEALGAPTRPGPRRVIRRPARGAAGRAAPHGRSAEPARRPWPGPAPERPRPCRPWPTAGP